MSRDKVTSDKDAFFRRNHDWGKMLHWLMQLTKMTETFFQASDRPIDCRLLSLTEKERFCNCDFISIISRFTCERYFEMEIPDRLHKCRKFNSLYNIKSIKCLFRQPLSMYRIIIWTQISLIKWEKWRFIISWAKKYGTKISTLIPYNTGYYIVIFH